VASAIESRSGRLSDRAQLDEVVLVDAAYNRTRQPNQSP